jgi:glycine cleavage system H protein
VRDLEGRARWGVDALTAALLDRATAVVLPAEGTRLVQGKVACWVMDDGELVPLRSPVSGTVTRTNHVLQRDPSLLARAPYDDGWLADVDVAGRVAQQPGLVSPEGRRETAARRMDRFRRAAAGYLHADPGVGPTACDGGAPLAEWRLLLGSRRYHRLVFSVLR